MCQRRGRPSSASIWRMRAILRLLVANVVLPLEGQESVVSRFSIATHRVIHPNEGPENASLRLESGTVIVIHPMRCGTRSADGINPLPNIRVDELRIGAGPSRAYRSHTRPSSVPATRRRIERSPAQ